MLAEEGDSETEDEGKPPPPGASSTRFLVAGETEMLAFPEVFCGCWRPCWDGVVGRIALPLLLPPPPPTMLVGILRDGADWSPRPLAKLLELTLCGIICGGGGCVVVGRDKDWELKD